MRRMKESGMEKLIELLNEYGKTSKCGPFEYYRIESATDYNSSYLVLQRDDNGEGDWKDWFLDIPRLISKEYGFIKWLVYNDKIDFYKLEKIGYIETVYGYDGQYRKIVEYSDYEDLLMLLAIQDNPISFLISVLK